MAMELTGTRLLHTGQSFRAHTSLADYCPHTVAFDDVSLVGFFANAGGRSRRRDLVVPVVFEHDRATMIEDIALQADRRLMLHQVSVDGISSRVHLATHQNHVADVQAANPGFADWGLKPDFLSRSGETTAAAHRHRELVIAVEPAFDGSSPGVQNDPKPPKGPAIIGHGDKEAGGQPVQDSYLATNQRHAPAESHGPDPERIGCGHDVVLQPR